MDIITAFIGVTISVLLSLVTSFFHPPQMTQDYDHDFFRFPVEFRASAKSGTTLGQLPRPLYVFPKPTGQVLAFKQSGETVDVPFQIPDRVDVRRTFFDVYSDRIFYISDGVGKVIRIGDKSASVLPDSIQQELVKKFCFSTFPCNHAEILAVRGNVLVVGGGAYAARDEYAAFDIQTGKLLYRAQAAGYDIARIYRLYLPEGTIVLTLNSKGPPRTSYGPSFGGTHPGLRKYVYGSQADNMDVYLDHSDLKYTPFPNDFDPLSSDDWTGPVFTIGKSPFFSDKKPIYSYPAKAKNPDKMHDNLYSVRDLFVSVDGHLLLEVDDGILLIDANTNSTKFVDDPAEVESLLKDASLIAPDAEDYRLWGNCPFSEPLNNQQRPSGFCLT